MGISYGYCDGISNVTWKVDHANGYVAVGAWGVLNVILVKTTTTEVPLWYDDATYYPLRAWVDLIRCTSYHIPQSGNINIQVNSIYRWKPKISPVDTGDVINYNMPCTADQRRRKGIRSYITCGVQGIGALSYTTFESALGAASNAILSMSGVNLTSSDLIWTRASCTKSAPINDWARFSLQNRSVTAAPHTLPEWTSFSITVDGLDKVQLSTLKITEVTYYTDQSPTVTDFKDVIDILTNRADVSNCPS